MGQYERHSRDSGFIKISDYKSDDQSIYQSLMFGVPNGYLKFLEKQVLFFTVNVKGLGRAVVHTTILHNIEINEPRKIILFRFEVKPKSSRGQIYYLVASHMDILHSVNLSTIEIWNNERSLIEVLTRYVQMFELEVSHMYKKLVIRVKRHNRTAKHDFSLENSSFLSQSHRESYVSYREHSLIHQSHQKTPETFTDGSSPLDL